MPTHTISISDETNKKFKIYKAMHGLNSVSDVVEKIARTIEIPPNGK